MELLSDGTVMASGAGGGASKDWYRLTPDASGSYVNGTWSSLASMSLERLYMATNVLQDGRVFALGGEYTGPNSTANWTNTGEIYDPITNTWSSIPNFPQGSFGDDPSMLLPDGRVIAGYLSGPQTYIYDPATNSWSTGPTKLSNDQSDEETWIKLPDDSILSYNVFGNPQHAQRLDPSSMTWIDSGSVPVTLQASDSELGGGVLLPDGRVFLEGGTSNTALYTPSATPGGTGTWAAGPVIPGGLGGNDSPVAMMPNGIVLFAAGATPSYNGPTHIFEFDPNAPIASSLTDVTPATPNLSGSPSYVTRMLMLPSGQVLFTNGGSQLYVYTPSGSAQAAWKPTVTSIAPNGSNYTLTGTQLNGLSAGASYGDDAEMDTNYPIVELNDGAGNVYFARTSNWSSTGVATGSTPVTTDFSLPAGIPNGTYSLYVVANGIASDPFSFTVGGVTQSADLAVTNTGPASSNEGDNATYTITVTNNGPSAAASATLIDTLGANLTFISATTGQGTFTQANGVVTFSFGTLAVDQSVTATVTAKSTEDGVVSESASASSSVTDPNSNNNTAVASTTVAESPITVSGPITIKGRNVNTNVATFTHANGVEPASAFIATINWGDGTTSTGTITQSGANYSVRGTHRYGNNGLHTVTTTVIEGGASPLAPSAVPPKLTSVSPFSSLIGLITSHVNQSASISSATLDSHLASGSNSATTRADYYFSQTALKQQSKSAKMPFPAGALTATRKQQLSHELAANLLSTLYQLA
jgi:uncharacterized repeat protein (TIGR01451 family)